MRLHIGGKEVKEGWTILNAQKSKGVDIVGYITDLSQFPDNSAEEVYASHVFEHVPQVKALDTLKGINRIIQTGGKFYLSVPNLEVLSRLFIQPRLNIKQKWHVMRMMFGGQVDEYDYHYAGWTLDFMKNFVRQAGFTSITQVESFGIFRDSSEFKPYGVLISLNMIIRK